MRNTERACASLALALTVSAGLAVAHQPEDRGARPATITADRAQSGLRSCDWFNGRNVVNPAGDTIAEVSDLLLERGSGRIDYAVLKTGTVLGMGGRTIAIPFSDLRWDPAAERLTLSMQKEQLERLPEFSKEAWTGREAGKWDKFWKSWGDDEVRDRDVYGSRLEGAKTERIEGEVTSVRRTRAGDMGEQVEIEVKTSSGETRSVALGPSWFVGGTSAAPMRGDKVSIEVMTIPQDTDNRSVATQMRSGERELRLRESGGRPAWSGDSLRSGDQEYRSRYWQNVLVSDVKGSRVDCRGAECGKVDDVIVDSRTGEVLMLSIDPNENFLGIADTKRLVPWSVATVGLDGTVRIDATKEMVLASPETPGDLSTLNAGNITDRVYKAYEVSGPMTHGREMGDARDRRDDRNNPARAGDPWSRHGAILSSMDSSADRTIDGKVVEVTQVTFDDNAPPARAIRVSSGIGEETVLIGPASAASIQDLDYRAGQPIKVEVRRVTIGGKTYFLARSVQYSGRTSEMLDRDGVPAWERR